MPIYLIQNYLGNWKHETFIPKVRIHYYGLHYFYDCSNMIIMYLIELTFDLCCIISDIELEGTDRKTS